MEEKKKKNDNNDDDDDDKWIGRKYSSILFEMKIVNSHKTIDWT